MSTKLLTGSFVALSQYHQSPQWVSFEEESKGSDQPLEALLECQPPDPKDQWRTNQGPRLVRWFGLQQMAHRIRYDGDPFP